MIEEYYAAVAALVNLRGESDRELARAEHDAAASDQRQAAEQAALERRVADGRRRLEALLDRARSSQIPVDDSQRNGKAGGSDAIAMLEQTVDRLGEALDAARRTREVLHAERDRLWQLEAAREAEQRQQEEAAAARLAAAHQRDRTLQTALALAALASAAAGLLVRSAGGIVVPLVAAMVVFHLAADPDNTLTARAAKLAGQGDGLPPFGATPWPWFVVLAAAALFGAYGAVAVAGAGVVSLAIGLGIAGACVAAVLINRARSLRPDPNRGELDA